jgi:hypothetical protein
MTVLWKGDNVGYKSINMKEVAFRDWRFLCDSAATEKMNNLMEQGGAEQCGCAPCKNFIQYRDNVYPQELLNVFQESGISTDREVEIYHVLNTGNGVHKYGGWFHFVGRMLVGEDCKSPIADGSGYELKLKKLSEDFEIGFTTECLMWPDSMKDKEGIQLEFMTNIPWVIDDSEPD